MNAPTLKIDTTGMRCPLPVLALGNATSRITSGTTVEITGDCPTFESDIRKFCQRRGKTIVAVRGMAPRFTIAIRF